MKYVVKENNVLVERFLSFTPLLSVPSVSEPELEPLNEINDETEGPERVRLRLDNINIDARNKAKLVGFEKQKARRARIVAENEHRKSTNARLKSEFDALVLEGIAVKADDFEGVASDYDIQDGRLKLNAEKKEAREKGVGRILQQKSLPTAREQLLMIWKAIDAMKGTVDLPEDVVDMCETIKQAI